MTQLHPIAKPTTSRRVREVIGDRLLQIFYSLFQFIITLIFAPQAPKAKSPLEKPLGRIAIIGAGVTGVSSAAHCVANGFDVVIYESKSQLGGIWSAVNQTSSLQLNSLLYRFHPAVIWSRGFPVKQHEILSEITRIWETYQLESHTKFDFTVRNVNRLVSDGKTQWTINGGEDGVFDGLIVAIGTCGQPKTLHALGREKFTGPVVHSSDLDGLELRNKRVVAIGGGASGVEAVELAVNSGAAEVSLLSRTDKWFIPRNWFFSVIMGTCPYSLQNSFGRLVEHALVAFHYRNLRHLTPAHKRFYSDTPIVNDIFFEHVRNEKARYIRGDLLEILPETLKINVRHDRTSQAGNPGVTEFLKADVLIDATGYERPVYDFLPTVKLFPSKAYSPPNIFLQTFSTADPSCLMTNAAYVNAVGAAGHLHIGISTRMMIMFLLEPETAPKPEEMKRWVDQSHSLEFFTYMELILWFISFHLTSVARLRWIIFTLFGWGFMGPKIPPNCQIKTQKNDGDPM
ncbi:hypothetical protein CROQUDRAFT_723246 [Cronartium quercuum f. sp. fusiforme G11]|uniref:Flavin-containing monooxygenase n=1 Tax=Cronartium quercuum f. sp. fusiforme G11 TaxID=708437 RepID=A0A9P6NKC7_9BASI|nr:hypothetical protein CROQUDRAFT_723246 [Cronartium quercuum f. sp. fusiforme G11]